MSEPAQHATVILPAEIRRVLLDLAAEVLGTLPEVQVPAGLRKIRGFAPARRARAGAAPLALALEREPGFRAQVAAAWRAADPDLAAALDAGEVGAALDPTLLVLGLYLRRPDGWEAELEQLLATIAADRSAAGQLGELDAVQARVRALEGELAQAQGAVRVVEEARAELAEDVTTLRREQRRLRSDADRARSAVRESERRGSEEGARLTALLAERDDRVRAAEALAQQAQEQLATVRRSAKDGRSQADLRARLLLDAIVESASALRRELALPPAEQAPADQVAAELATEHPADAGPAPMVPRGLDADDPALLAEMLRVPRAHLLVDGYNVSMQAYGSLPLVDQRRLLVDALAALAARTSAEVTCCFDGAEVDVRPAGLVRGVRVLFSAPGTTADDLLRRLVRAEPRGRMLVVVSSDREVAETVVAAGARSVPSVLLLRLLGAGSRDRRR